MSHHTHFVECGLSVENNDIIVNYMAFNLQKYVSSLHQIIIALFINTYEIDKRGLLRIIISYVKVH